MFNDNKYDIKRFTIPQIVTYVPLLIIIIAIIFNTIAFFILIFDRNLKRISSMRYLGYIALFDTLSLFGWNLDQFNFYSLILESD